MRALLIALFLAASATLVAEEVQFPNGRANCIDHPGAFCWDNGGGDPLTVTWEQVLERVDNLPEETRNELLRLMDEVRKGSPTHQVQEGDQEDIMFSGDGWAAVNVIARVDRWKTDRSRDAWEVRVMDDEGREWRFTTYRVCENAAITSFNAPVQCRCEERDAC